MSEDDSDVMSSMFISQVAIGFLSGATVEVSGSNSVSNTTSYLRLFFNFIHHSVHTVGNVSR